MRRWPDPLDRLLRGLLRLPGLLVDVLDGPRVVEGAAPPEAVFPLVRAAARHPEAYLALEPGLHHTVHEGLVLAWDHRGRTAFAVGGLNAPPGAKGALLEAFRRDAEARGVVRQLVFPLRRDELDEARATGFQAVQVGVEAWLDLPGLTLRGGRYAHARGMRSRARRRGVAVEEVRPDGCAADLDEVHRAWLAARRPSWRMKLLVGSPALERPFDRRYLVARRAGRIEAFVTLLPGAPGVWGVDVMARRPDAPPGAMEALLLHAAEALRDEGARALSLGACPMARVPVGGERPVLTRIFRLLYASSLGNRLFGFRSLLRFKDKLRPRYAPVYVAASPHMGVAALYRGCRMWGLY